MARERFLATREWPTGRKAEARADAVQALVANHTLIVGQSRSGKTNAARRLLEEILLWTDARITPVRPERGLLLAGPSESENGRFRSVRQRRVSATLGSVTATHQDRDDGGGRALGHSLAEALIG